MRKLAALLIVAACQKTTPKPDKDPFETLDKVEEHVDKYATAVKHVADASAAAVRAEHVRLDAIVDDTDAAIADKDWDRAELLASKLHWRADPWAGGANTERDAKAYDDIREARMDVIQRHR